MSERARMSVFPCAGMCMLIVCRAVCGSSDDLSLQVTQARFQGVSLRRCRFVDVFCVLSGRKALSGLTKRGNW